MTEMSPWKKPVAWLSGEGIHMTSSGDKSSTEM
jgi:hypothetical protein